MSEIAVFNFGETGVRAGADEQGNPWWVARDVCHAIGISKYRDALADLDDDERVYVFLDTPGGMQQMACVTESGLHALILKGKKAVVRKFRKWITSDVIPAILKTGSYQLKPEQPPAPKGLPGPREDMTAAILLMAEKMPTLVPGMRKEMIGACTIASLERAGIPAEPMRLALPAREDAKLTVTPTQIAKQISGGALSANYINMTLAAMGFQSETGSGWELTDAGQQYGELIPYQSKYSNKAGHQIRWKPEVAELVREWIETGKSRELAS